MKNAKKTMSKETFTPTSLENLIKEAGPDVQKEMRLLQEQYSLSRKLLHLRLDAGITQAQMAELMNRSQSYISKIENAENSRISLEEFSLYVLCTQQKTKIERPMLADSVVDGLASFLIDAFSCVVPPAQA